MLRYEKIFDIIPKLLENVAYLDLKFWASDLLTNIKILIIYLFAIILMFLIDQYNPMAQKRKNYLVEMPTLKPKKDPNKLERIFLDPTHLKKIVDKFTQLSISPAEYNRLIDEPFTGMNTFRLILLDFIRRNIILISKHTLCINIDRLDELKAYEHRFIQILLNNMSFREEGIYQTISLVDFINHLVAQHNQISLASNQLEKLISGYTHDVAIRKNANSIKAYFRTQDLIQDLKSDLNFLETAHAILEYYAECHAINPVDLYALASITPLSHDKITIEHFNVAPHQTIDLSRFYYELGYILDISAARIDPSVAPELTFEK